MDTSLGKVSWLGMDTRMEPTLRRVVILDGSFFMNQYTDYCL